MKDKYTPGQDCGCYAYSESECGCGADWTPSEVHELRGKLERERALVDRLAEILQRIANEDYRGNRPHHCVVADCGVKAWKEARSE
jgi:hypothetical protein